MTGIERCTTSFGTSAFGLDPSKGKNCQAGFGFGVQLGADTAIGAGAAGAAGTGSGGAGLFFGGGTATAGLFASGGAAAYAGNSVLNAPAPSMGGPSSLGFGIGPIGGGVFITNASSASQLNGPFYTLGGAVSVGLGLGAQVSFGTDAAGNFIWQGGLTMGAGFGTYGYSLTTTTKAVTTGVPCS